MLVEFKQTQKTYDLAVLFLCDVCRARTGGKSLLNIATALSHPAHLAQSAQCIASLHHIILQHLNGVSVCQLCFSSCFCFLLAWPQEDLNSNAASSAILCFPTFLCQFCIEKPKWLLLSLFFQNCSHPKRLMAIVCFIALRYAFWYQFY